jgi:hypothetical protein
MSRDIIFAAINCLYQSLKDNTVKNLQNIISINHAQIMMLNFYFQEMAGNCLIQGKAQDITAMEGHTHQNFHPSFSKNTEIPAWQII